jgi:hypothetical protein
VSAITDKNRSDLAEHLAVSAVALAERFSSGGTLWSIAPRHPEHARHLAVEFVHPVIVGKPALPAVSLDDSDLVGAARAMVRRGDVVVVVGDPEPVALDVLQRCAAWGAMSIWIGSGRRSGADLADHLLWLDDDDARHDGRLVLIYHLLWELTHMCLERGSVVRPDADPRPRTQERCITCSDDAKLGEIVELEPDGRATVRVDGGMETVDVALMDDPSVNDLVLVHAGTAITSVTSAGDAP